MRAPASAFENRTHSAQKIRPSRYSDFLNKIRHQPPRRSLSAAAARPPTTDTEALDRRGACYSEVGS